MTKRQILNQSIQSQVPSVDKLLRNDAVIELIEIYGRQMTTSGLRTIISKVRLDIKENGQKALEKLSDKNLLLSLQNWLEENSASSLKQVFNLTGTVLHTNLGRAPLPEEAIKAITELKASPKRVCVCTDDRDADDLFNFGLDWVVRETHKIGIDKTTAWSMGSLHPATRFKIDHDYGALGHSRRADIVMLDDDLKIINTWLGGKLVVENKKITSLLDEQLSNKKYLYPKKAYQTIKLPKQIDLIPKIPDKDHFKINVIKTELPGIMTLQETITINNRINDWTELLESKNICHLCVIERHGKTGESAHGFLKNFNLKSGAIASSVGHDAHNIIVAGLNIDDMQLAINTIQKDQGGVVIINNGKIVSKIQLNIAGLLSDKKASQIAKENEIFKKSWLNAGCTLAYMGFNLLTLSVIPNFRLTNKGLIDVNSMSIVPLFE